MNKFAATYTTCVQISPDDFKIVRTTKVFDSSQDMQDVSDWLEGLRERNRDVIDHMLIMSPVKNEEIKIGETK